MARSRNIKPGIVLNDALAGLAHWVRLLFVYLWTIADRAGRLEDKPKRIGAALFPYEADLSFEDGLQQLHEAGFIQRYEVDGARFIQITNWAKHQNPHPKESASVIPAPRSSNELVTEKPRLVTAMPEQATEIPERARLIPSSLIPDSLSPLPDTGVAAQPLLAAAFQRFMERYPAKVGLDLACRTWLAVATEELIPLIEAGLTRWLDSDQWARDDGRYIPAPARWLQDRRWRDYPAGQRLEPATSRRDPFDAALEILNKKAS
jgi:hypothetical protein